MFVKVVFFHVLLNFVVEMIIEVSLLSCEWH